MAEELRLRNYQQGARELLRQGMREGNRRQILANAAGTGKCLGIDTPVMLASGMVVPVQDIKVGDRLMGPDGAPRVVISLAQGREAMYRLTPIKGEPYVVNASHILSLRSGAKLYTMTAREFADATPHVRKERKTWRAPLIESFERIDPSLPLPPYILGAWLGDGRADSPVICKPMCNMVREWCAYAESVGITAVVYKYQDRCANYAMSTKHGSQLKNPVLNALRELSLINNKHIPDRYKFGSAQMRRELIAGLIDSDGHIKNGGCDWISVSKTLAEDFAFVARSLGLACYVMPCRKGISSTEFVGDYFRCYVSGDLSMLPMRDKSAAPRRQIKSVLVSQLSIEGIGEGDYYGFSLAGPDRLFLLGDFTVTHNTEVAIDIAQEARRKMKRSLIITDRTVLVDNFSQRLDRYGLPHGVMQAQHWRWHPQELIQVASAQTLESRGFPEDIDVVVIDEAQDVRVQIAKWLVDQDKIAIGLSATPFNPKLRAVYSNVVNTTTTNAMTRDGWLVPLLQYHAKPIDMRGAAVNKAGEWSDKDVLERARAIYGDVVTTWIQKTTQHFGGPVKTVGWGFNIAHCEEMAAAFNELGFNFKVVTSKGDSDTRNRELIEEFREPDSAIHGLLTCEIFTRGFDVPDVLCGISCRPYRKSLSNHIQQMARLQRPFESPTFKKEYGLWLCHSLNCLRFADDVRDFWENGVQALDEHTLSLDKKVRKEPTPQDIRESSCSACGEMMYSDETKCPKCGHVKVRTAKVPVHAGRVEEFNGGGIKAQIIVQERSEFYAQLKGYGLLKGYAEGWAANQFRTKYKEWPNDPAIRNVKPADPGPKVKGWITHSNIRRAHSRAKA